jgi:hypothetical protein
MSAALAATDNDHIILRHQINDIETKVRECRPDVFLNHLQTLTPPRRSKVLRILGVIVRRTLPIAAIHSVMVRANQSRIFSRPVQVGS